uniref:Ion transport domain-containing protein n=1 Tax=Eutreptiella gymnastica TaxID=73025 RepID=A0A6T2BTT3_9EUGL
MEVQRFVSEAAAARRPSMREKPARPPRTQLYRMIRDHSHRPESQLYRACLTTLILLNVVAFIWSTDDWFWYNYQNVFYYFEAMSSCLFLLDYAFRIYSAPQSQKLSRKGTVGETRARLNWIFSYPGLIDLLSLLPFFLEVALQDYHVNLPNFTYLRILRLSRLMKSSVFKDAWDCFERVMYYNRSILGVSATLCLVLLILTSTAMYYLAPKESASDEDFSSILACIYLCILMLTGQGGPEGELPWYTKVVCSCTAIFSVALFAIPASMLTWGFEAEAERLMKKQHQRKRNAQARVAQGLPPVADSSSSSDGMSTDSEWEDYEGVVVDDDEDDEPEGKPSPEGDAGPGQHEVLKAIEAMAEQIRDLKKEVAEIKSLVGPN